VSGLGRKLLVCFSTVADRSVILAIVFVGICLSATTTTTFDQSPTVHRVQLLSMQTSPSKSELEKQKLQLEVNKLKMENTNNERSLRTVAGWRNLIFQNPLAAVTLVLGIFGLGRYFQQRNQEIRDKQNARFEEIVRGLGGEREQQQVSSALLLPTFLERRYKRFHVQVFNLAAGNLRSSALIEASDSKEQPRAERDESTPSPPKQALTNVLREFFNLAAGNLRSSALIDASDSKEQPRAERDESTPSPPKQALANVLRESFPLARKRVVRPGLVALVRQRLTPQDERDERDERQKIDGDLNATAVNLDRVFLSGADLNMGSWREGLFRKARLRAADLKYAVLEGADFSQAELNAAVFTGANLTKATFTGANLDRAVLSGCQLQNANFRGAILSKVRMVGGIAGGIDLSGADLTGATFRDVEFDAIPPDTEQAKPEAAKKLSGTVFENVSGLSKHQIGLCEERGAIFRSRTSSSESAPGDNAAKVSLTSPPNRGEGVALNSEVTAIFSKDMDPATLNTTTFKLVEKPTNTPIAGTVRYDPSTNSATFTPAMPLASATSYQATITTDVKDQAGNTLDEDYTWQWKSATSVLNG
jgi:uncharacterized protein YjbI with pentapeptide repeats